MKKLLVALIVAAFAFTTPVLAADLEYSFDGRIRFDTHTTDVSKDAWWASANDSDDDLTWSHPGSSRVRFHWSKGNLSGTADFRPGGAWNEMWAQWDFGAGTLAFGLMDGYEPSFAPVSDLNLGAFGMDNGGVGNFGSSDMMVLTLPLGAATVTIAALEPFGPSVTRTLTAATADVDRDMPGLEAGVDFAFGPFAMRIFGGMQSYTEVNTATNVETDIDADVVGGVIRFGSGPFYAGLHAYKATNGYMEAQGFIWDGTPAYGTGYNAATNTVIDSEVEAWAIGAGYFINDMFMIQAGYGEKEKELENTFGTGGVDNYSAWYICLPITITQGFTITPEYSVDDWEDQKTAAGVVTQEGDTKYFGARWVINF